MIVKKLRAEKNWSQEQVARFSGLSIRTIQRVESGQSASLETLKSLASVFEVEISTLTEEINVIDKKSEHWKTQPWWFRLWALGVDSRQVQVGLKYLLLAVAIGLTMASYFEPIFTKFSLITMYLLFIQTTCIQYGDKNKSWGYES
ncbi:helix-turn-helix domain-containing protein [Thalassotalea aquiviva]|uniref:helix-turn-helix domain-containing protein n=1 Tax=Thalassotalea aquiviva TaxID=3242415 RepID=UPI00352B537D